MRILTDRHHHALMESLELTLGDRLGAQIYYPYGMEWFERDYWLFEKAAHGDAVARQYLLGVWGDVIPSMLDEGVVSARDPREPTRVNHGITLEAALEQQWDIVLCSLPHNYDGFYKLARETDARYGIQLGNDVQPFDTRADFALSSSTLPGFGPEYIGQRFDYMGVPTVMYHQEFSLDTFRHEWPPTNRNVVASFVNCFPEGPSYPDFTQFARTHPDFDWRVYGATGTPGPDEFTAGDLGTTPEVGDAMRASRIGWHSKHWSDGFGHTIHNWFSVGRPVIGYQHYYQSKLAGPLWVDGVTSFDLGRRTADEVAEVLRRLRDDDSYHLEISQNAASRFTDLVDFDYEAELIGELLGLKVPVAA